MERGSGGEDTIKRGSGGKVKIIHFIQSALPIFAVALVTLDLMQASYGFNPASDPLLLDFTPPTVQFLQNEQAEGAIFRFTTLDDPAQRPILNANSGWFFGLHDIRGYDSIIPKQYVEYMSTMAVQGQLGFNRIAPFFTSDMRPAEGETPGVLQPDSPLLDWLNVRYILTHRSTNLFPAEGDTAWKVVHEDEALKIYENPDALPRAFVIPETDFDATWLLSLPSPPAPLPKGEGSRITQDSGREKFVDVTLENASWLIISENFAPGWRAFVRPVGAGDDAETAYEVQRVLGMFQGVRLPAGAWTVRLVYSPTSFQVGLFGSIISIGILTLMIGTYVWRLMVGDSDEKSSTTARVARNSIAPILLNLFNRGMDFALLIVILRILSPENVGTYYYLVVIFEWFDIFTNFGLDLFLVREVARDKSRAGHYLFNVSLLRLLLCGVGVPLLMGFLFIRQSVVTPELNAEALLTVGLLYIGLFPASLSKGMTSLFYAFEQAEKPAAIATITSINKAVFQVMVLLLGYGIVGLAVVSIFNNIITLGVLWVAGQKLIYNTPQPPLNSDLTPQPPLLKERGRFRIDFPLLRRITIESVPLLLNHFLATIFFKVDVILLEAMKGAVVVAQYSVAYRWILAINIIPSFFTQALLPVMSRQAQSDKAALHRTYIFGIKLLVLLAFPLAVWFTFLAEPLTYFMGGQQYLPDGAIAIQLMIWSIPIGWMNSLTQYALVALDLQRFITRAFFIAVSFNLVTNLLLIPAFSYPAAALTTIASEAVLLIPFLLLMRRGLDMPLRWIDLVWRPAAATIVMLMTTFILWRSVPSVALPIGTLVYGTALFFLRPLAENELALFRRMLPGRVANIRNV
jgi:O-antigen/teichoic acid export membrane protein